MDNLTIRRATAKDIPRIQYLLRQVCDVHADARPDLFVHGEQKYHDNELKKIIDDDSRPIFVAISDDIVIGYAFCIHQQHNVKYLTDIRTLYIDDLCVDANNRRGGVGKALYDYVLNYAKSKVCYNVTLNVWADNKAALAFYQKIGLNIQKIGMEKIL